MIIRKNIASQWFYFIWLGFWFKYTFSLVFFDGIVYDSGPPSNLKNIDKALIVSIVAITAVFLSYVVRQKFVEIKKYKEKTKSLFEKIYLENKKIVIFLFIIDIQSTLFVFSPPPLILLSSPKISNPFGFTYMNL